MLAVALATGAAAGAADATAASPAVTAAATPTSDVTPLVNQFIGTRNAGLDFPAAGAPFGMVQEAPQVYNPPGAAGNQCDSPSAREIYGFSQTTINGCRFNYVPVMPTTGSMTSTDPHDYASRFSRSSEQARPDSYRVHLTRYGVDVGLTATTRTGWQQYRFPRTSRANVLFNTGQGVSSSNVHIVGDRTVEGWVQDSRRTYFVAQLSRPFSSHGTWQGTQRNPGSTQSTHSGANGGWVSFDTTTDDDPVVVKIGLSYTGLAGAAGNLAAETDKFGFDFDAAQQALNTDWNTMLHKATISGGTHDQQVAFYTALYHSVLDPNVIGDSDGRYLGFDGKLHTASGFTPYSNLSLWDTYRTQNQLVEMIAPQVAHDVDLSILAIAEQGGWLPRWYLGTQEGNIMTGDPITPYLVEGWSKGLLTGKTADEAYRLVRKNANQVPPASAPENGRAAADYYNRLGYIPYGLHVTSTADCPAEGAQTSCCPSHGADNDCYYPASTALEYAAADSSLALMARGLGHTQDAQAFATRGQSYRNIFDTSTGLFRPRTMDGTWLSPYNTKTGDHAFHEGDPAQYQWLVPQDPSGLISLLGGRSATNDRLDDFFAYSDLLNDPSGTAAHTWVYDPFAYYGPTTYAPDNEPNLLAPYLYNWTGRPDKTATVVRAAESLYTNSPDGMTGNDDMGEMSAWYVMSALGLYPTMSGANFYAVTTPEFPKATVQVGTFGDKQGGTLTISAPGASADTRYIASARVNGTASSKSWVTQDDIAHGGTIDYSLSDSPTQWATAAADAPPSINDATLKRDQLSAQLSPPRAMVEPTAVGSSSQQLTLTLLATTSDDATLRVKADAPAGWSVAPATTSMDVEGGAVPRELQVPITVTAPAGTRPGSYPVSVQADMPGADGVRTSSTVDVAAPGRCALHTDDSCAVDLGSDYDLDGIAATDRPGDGNFDGTGHSFPADQLPAAGPTRIGGVTYQAPSTSGDDPNFVTADGQAIALPTGRYRRLDILGAAAGGDTGSSGRTAVVSYTDGTTSTVDLHLTDWTSDTAAVGNSVALHVSNRVGQDPGEDATDVSLFHTSVRIDVHKTVRAISLPGAAVPIWVAPGLTGYAWDHDSSMHLYAMTLRG